MVRVVRARHPLEGRSLELIGWMRRGGSLGLILVLPDGSRALVPAGWTDLEPPAGAPRAGTLGSLQDLFGARRVVDGLLSRAVLAGGDDCREPDEETDSAALPRSAGVPGAGGGAVGAARRRAPTGSDGVVERADRPDGAGLGGGGR
ncbi:MAG: hypothetical protein ACREX8_12835 [Gammaproteobacteria bacterium]